MASESRSLSSEADSGKTTFVAIDLGTTYSACAFAIGKNSSDIFYASEKVPTAVLLTSEEKLHSFGQEAMDEYFKNLEDHQRKGFLYFDRFKMKLQRDSVSSDFG